MFGRSGQHAGLFKVIIVYKNWSDAGSIGKANIRMQAQGRPTVAEESDEADTALKEEYKKLANGATPKTMPAAPGPPLQAVPRSKKTFISKSRSTAASCQVHFSKSW